MIPIRSTIIISVLLLTLVVACTSVAEQNNLANTQTNAREFNSAIINYSSAQVDDPDNPVLYLNSAKAYFEQGSLDIAVEVLDQAILRGDETIQAQAYYNMGNFYYLSGQPEEAIDAYRESLLLNPDDANARHNLELAMLFLSTPTPIDEEMQTLPDENQIDPSVTPTFQPQDDAPPEPSPTPQIVSFDERTPEGGIEGDRFGNQGPMTPFPNETPTSTKKDASSTLEAVSDDESVYKQFSDEVSTPTNSDERKGW